MKTTLFNIETEYMELINTIEMNEGEITPEMDEQLAINETQLQSKSIAYASVITAKDSLNTQIDAEIKRLQAFKKANNNLTTRLKDRLLHAVNLFGAYEVGLTKFGTRKSTSVTVEDVNTLPDEFKTRKLTETANKTAIKEAIKRGEAVKGCELTENLNLKIN